MTLSEILKARRYNLNLADLGALIVLSVEDYSMGGIATELGLSTAAITGLADKLVKADYIKRSPHASDRRIQMLAITEQGSARIHQIAGPSF